MPKVRRPVRAASGWCQAEVLHAPGSRNGRQAASGGRCSSKPAGSGQKVVEAHASAQARRGGHDTGRSVAARPEPSAPTDAVVSQADSVRVALSDIGRLPLATVLLPPLSFCFGSRSAYRCLPLAGPLYDLQQSKCSRTSPLAVCLSYSIRAIALWTSAPG